VDGFRHDFCCGHSHSAAITSSTCNGAVEPRRSISSAATSAATSGPLYEAATERFFATHGWEFGMVGPNLLSDYIASDAGAELRDRLFDPAFLNPIDWTEIDRFDKSLAQLADYLNDERLFGIHLWTARDDVARAAKMYRWARCWPTH
jgi:hypothetical protein